MSWYSIVVTPNEISNGLLAKVENAFTETFIAQGAPKEANLWSVRSSETGNVTYYLSPVGYEISRISMLPFRPKPCETPDVSNLSICRACAIMRGWLFTIQQSLPKPLMVPSVNISHCWFVLASTIKNNLSAIASPNPSFKRDWLKPAP